MKKSKGQKVINKIVSMNLVKVLLILANSYILIKHLFFNNELLRDSLPKKLIIIFSTLSLVFILVSARLSKRVLSRNRKHY